MRQTLACIRVWDAPIRLFHWGIVLLIAASWTSQEFGWMRLHFLSGYTMIAALLFRLVWGIIGSDTARFSRFLRSPIAAFQHVASLRRRDPDTEIGHNAAGGWMVLVMLTLLAVQAGTGLFSNDEVSLEGPLARFVASSTSDWLSRVHAVNFSLIEAAIVLHLVAIAGYAALGHNLVRPMVTGYKRLPDTLPRPRMVTVTFAITVFGLIATGVAVSVYALGG